MAGDVTLTAAMRSGLLSSQKTETQIERTSRRLANGLKVSSAQDDAVAFFQARALNDRAADFAAIKDNISSGISTIKAAMDGLAGLEKILGQMKGIALGAKSESSPATRNDMYLQYDKLRTQIDLLAADASYSGLNLIGNPANDMTVNLSPADSPLQSNLTVTGAVMTSNSLGLDPVAISVDNTTYGTDAYKTQLMNDWVASIGRQTGNGSGNAVTTLATFDGVSMGNSLDPFGSVIGAPGYLSLYEDFASGVVSLNAANITSYAGHTAGSVQYQAALVLQDFLANGGTLGATVTNVGSGLAINAFTLANYPGGVSVRVPEYPWDSVTGYMDHIDHDIALVDSAVTTVRTTMTQMGSNTAMLQIRINYTEKLVNEAKQGASLLVNADLNEEGANLAALQTRQQIGTQSLKFTGNSEQGILSLFR